MVKTGSLNSDIIQLINRTGLGPPGLHRKLCKNNLSLLIKTQDVQDGVSDVAGQRKMSLHVLSLGGAWWRTGCWDPWSRSCSIRGQRAAWNRRRLSISWNSFVDVKTPEVPFEQRTWQLFILLPAVSCRCSVCCFPLPVCCSLATSAGLKDHYSQTEPHQNDWTVVVGVT